MKNEGRNSAMERDFAKYIYYENSTIHDKKDPIQLIVA